MAGQDSSKGTKQASGSAHQATFKDSPALLANWGGPGWLEVSTSDSSLQERQEGESRELQAGRCDFSNRESCGADHVECHHIAHMGQSCNQKQQGWVYEKLPVFKLGPLTTRRTLSCSSICRKEL